MQDMNYKLGNATEKGNLALMRQAFDAGGQLSAFGYELLDRAARGGHTDAMEMLLAMARGKGCVPELLRSRGFAAFSSSILNGNMDGIRLLVSEAHRHNMLEEMFEARNFETLVSAASGPDGEVFDSLISLSKQIGCYQTMVNEKLIPAFRMAMASDSAQIRHRMVAMAKHHKRLKACLKDNEFGCFRQSIIRGKQDTARYLVGLAKEESILPEMLIDVANTTLLERPVFKNLPLLKWVVELSREYGCFDRVRDNLASSTFWKSSSSRMGNALEYMMRLGVTPKAYPLGGSDALKHALEERVRKNTRRLIEAGARLQTPNGEQPFIPMVNQRMKNFMAQVLEKTPAHVSPYLSKDNVFGRGGIKYLIGRSPRPLLSYRFAWDELDKITNAMMRSGAKLTWADLARRDPVTGLPFYILGASARKFPEIMDILAGNGEKIPDKVWARSHQGEDLLEILGQTGQLADVFDKMMGDKNNHRKLLELMQKVPSSYRHQVADINGALLIRQMPATYRRGQKYVP